MPIPRFRDTVSILVLVLLAALPAQAVEDSNDAGVIAQEDTEQAPAVVESPAASVEPETVSSQVPVLSTPAEPVAPVPAEPAADTQTGPLAPIQADAEAPAQMGSEVPASAPDSSSVAGPIDAGDATDLPKAENVDLRQVVPDAAENSILPPALADEDEPEALLPQATETQALISTDSMGKQPNSSRTLLGTEVPASTTARLGWTPSKSFAGMAVDTPVLVVNGAWDGPTLCLTAAVHGDELNGIEMVRRVMYDLDPAKLHGMVVGVPIVNLLGFSRNSRYLPDRRDLNRYFPGNPRGSVASRLAHAFFQDVILHCNALVDLHTGSFYRTNITQLRADMQNPMVAEFADLFGSIPVLNTRGNRSSLRAAAVRAGIPTVTLEAGEPMRMQVEVVEEGVRAIRTLMEKNGMYPSFSLWAKPSPAFYRSTWVRANSSGILFSKVALGDKVKPGQLLGEVINPISNEKKPVVSKVSGRVLGMALDQFVLPGFAAYHIGILAPRDSLTPPSEEDEALIDEDYKPEQLGQPKPMTPEEEGFDDE